MTLTGGLSLLFITSLLCLSPGGSTSDSSLQVSPLILTPGGPASTTLGRSLCLPGGLTFDSHIEVRFRPLTRRSNLRYLPGSHLRLDSVSHLEAQPLPFCSVQPLHLSWISSLLHVVLPLISHGGPAFILR
jgi:hypothetical protein